MLRHSFLAATVGAFLFTSVLGSSADIHSVVRRQNQIVFPPANGPCPQNRGQTPFSCFASDCIDIPAPGVCNIQTQQGFPICGCCTNDEILCSACGGDAGGGICKGTGKSGVGFQGCGCTADDGGIDPGDATKVCPEHRGNGQNTFTCDNSACGGCTKTAGICDKRFPGKDSAGKSFLVYCAGCPAGDITCDSCGGDDGNGKCKGDVGSAIGTPYQGCKCGKSGTTLPPPIFPFPIPPPAFPPVPPGTGRPKKQCPETPEDKCSDCDGKNGWCQSGPSVSCMCKEDCPTGDDEPNCSAEDCKGEADEKCTVGLHIDCACKKEAKCPSAENILSCAECGGGTTDHKCKGLADQNNKWKDCDCMDFSDDSGDEYNPFSDSDYDMWDKIKAALPPASSPPPPDKPREHPSNNPTCGGNQASGLPSKVTTDKGDVAPKELQYWMREVLCNDKCEKPAGLNANSVVATVVADGCEIAIALPNNVEGYAYRGTHSQGLQWQDCWDSFMNITEKCVKDDPATGWVNGPDDYQFYQSGYRPINGDGSRHAPLDPKNALPDANPPAPPPPPAPTSEVAIPLSSPGPNGVQCTADDRGGWMADCWNLADKYTDDQQICSNDANVCPQPRTNSVCKATGAKCDPNGSSQFDISSYCVIGQKSSCALVLADKLSSFGFNGYYCTSGKELKEMIRREASADGCGGTPDQGRVAMWAVNNGASTLCMTGSEHPGVCGA